MNISFFALGAIAFSVVGGEAAAGTVLVPYTGSFDEAAVPSDPGDGLPAGDFDTIGGLADVGLFQLVEGTNTFTGSIYSPDDPSDGFNIEILTAHRLIGASIDWGTNLPGISFSIPVPSGYLQQTSFVGGSFPPPEWTLEESSVTPEIFTISGLEGTNLGQSPQTKSTGALDVGPGIYLSLLRDLSSTCAQSYREVDVDGQIGLETYCVEGIDYTMTFNVEKLPSPPPEVVPLPGTLPLALAGLGVFLGLSRRRS